MNDTDFTGCCETLCGWVDWEYPGLAGGAAARAWAAGDSVAAARGFVRYMRERKRPDLGYPASYIAQLRQEASPAFREAATRTIEALLAVPFLGGSWPDGRETFMTARPEEIQVAATREHFLAFAGVIAAARDRWSVGKQHTAGNIARYLQWTWALDDCPDDALLPMFGFLAVQLEKEWAGARYWSEASLGTSGHNWWVAEFARIWEMGLFFPELKGLARFQGLFPTSFEREMKLLIAPDGFTRETSFSYHIGTSDLFLDMLRVAERNGLDLSPEFRRKLRAMYDVEWRTMTPDGGHPAFGDGISTPRYVLDRLPSIAAIQGCGEAKWLVETLAGGPTASFGEMLIESLHYPSVGEDLRAAYDTLDARPPAEPDQALEDSGYYVMRRDWAADTDYAAIEASQRGSLVTSHGHGAIFDLRLYARGRQITVGNGKGPCGSPEPERTWRHQSLSHSVALVNGEHHVPLRSVYRFDQTVVPVVDDWRSEPEFAYFSGVHEAYNSLQPHHVPGARRKLFYRRGRYWILIDRFTTAWVDKTFTYQQHFQLATPSEMLADDRVTTTGDGGNLLFIPVPGIGGAPTIAPCPYPYEGHPEPDQLTFSRSAVGSDLLALVMVPYSGTCPDVHVELQPVAADRRQPGPWEITALAITIDGEREVYVDNHMPWTLPWTVDGHTSTERLWWGKSILES